MVGKEIGLVWLGAPFRLGRGFAMRILGSIAATLLLAIAAPASAVLVSVSHQNFANCDTLFVPANLDELGHGPSSVGPFPTNEEISSFDVPTGNDACISSFNTLVTMTNLTGTDWQDVWYVADPETSISNFDGLVNGELAFKIDSVGANSPLFFESIAFDGIFQAGEIWEFIIDDYVNTLGLPASAFRSCTPFVFPCVTGLVGILSGGDLESSGSIIALIPEPSTALLLGGGLLALGWKRKRIVG